MLPSFVQTTALLVWILGLQVSTAAAQPATVANGVQVSGRVVDSDGRPIAGAKVQFVIGIGWKEMSTDPDGHFALDNCQPGKFTLVAQADRYSPELKEIEIGDRNQTLEFKLATGRTLRVRIVDVDGRPIAGAGIYAETWRGYHTQLLRTSTDAEGRVTWPSAPEDATIFDIVSKDFLQIRGMPLRAGNDEVVITMQPKLQISGVVVDAESGKAIPNFQIHIGRTFTGSRQMAWRVGEAQAFTGGNYSITLDEPADGYAIEVVAADYRPAKSRVFKTDEHSATFTFKLQPSNGPAGVVLLPSGKPAQDAEVLLSTPQQRMVLENGRFSRLLRGAAIVKTDENGIFQLLPSDDESYRIIVIHADGFAEVTRAEFEKSRRINLQAWGRIEGRSLVGDKPDANRKIGFVPKLPLGDGLRSRDYRYSAKTDDAGQFMIERVLPGAGYVTRAVVIQENQSMWMEVPSWFTDVEVKPGETAHVTIGGTGRTVVGQIKPDHEPDVPIVWTRNSPVEIVNRDGAVRDYRRRATFRR